MAKKADAEKVNVSKIIREYYADHPKDKPKAIAAALAEQGLDIKPGYVSTILTLTRKKAGKAARRERKAGSGAGSAGAVEKLIAAKKLVDQMGGIDKAQEALSALARILK